MSTTSLPSYDDVHELPALLEGVVSPDFIDLNGHMNIRHYLDAGAFSADVLCRQIGIDDAYRTDRRLGVFTVEHHIRYFAEMHLGTTFSVRAIAVDRSDRAFHVLSLILDTVTQRLACTVEIMLVGVGMDSRRPAAFPVDIAGRMDSLLADTRGLGWTLPLSGTMGIRRA